MGNSNNSNLVGSKTPQQQVQQQQQQQQAQQQQQQQQHQHQQMLGHPSHSQLLNHQMHQMAGMPPIQYDHGMASMAGLNGLGPHGAPQGAGPKHIGAGVGGGGGVGQDPNQVVYLGAQPPMGQIMGHPQQSQFVRAAAAAAAAGVNNPSAVNPLSLAQMTTNNAKKLWDKGGISDVRVPTSGSLGPLQLHGPSDGHPVWRDSTWSTQTESILASRRAFAQAPDINPAMSAGILRYFFFID